MKTKASRAWTAVAAAAFLMSGCGSAPPERPPERRVRSRPGPARAAAATPPGHWDRLPHGRQVARYLMHYAHERDLDCGPHACKQAGIARWRLPPVVRVHEGATALEAAQTRYAVALVNRALPYRSHVRIGAPTRTAVPGGDDWYEAVPEGTMTVQFVERSASQCPEEGGCANAWDDGTPHNVWNRTRDRWDAGDISRGFVLINRERYEGHPPHVIVTTLVHELLHAVGLFGGPDPVPGASVYGHLPDGTPGTLMAYETDPNILAGHGRLPTLDEAALIALYGPNAIGSTAPEALYEQLADWAAAPAAQVRDMTAPIASVRYVRKRLERGDVYEHRWAGETRDVEFTYLGNGAIRGCYVAPPRSCQRGTVGGDGDELYNVRTQTAPLPVRYGVLESNGVLVPWTEGPVSPHYGGALKGSATWSGGLAGLTPGLDPVEGDAAIILTFGAVRHDGAAAFTALEYGETGEVWGDGDLHYTLAGAGNTFHSTAGGPDAGDVNGRLYGFRHDGAAGTLERHDLTAAFGATKE